MTREYRNSEGLLHRDGDLPAQEREDGIKWWWKNGKVHREGGRHAVENGTYKAWMVNGKQHREGGLPAVENGNHKQWWVNGLLHRDVGPAIERADGTAEWYVNGQRHRNGGLPAAEYVNGDKEWWVNGRLHREDGLPACEYAHGKSQEWWVNGIHLSEQNRIAYGAFCQKMKENKRVRAQKKIYFWWIQICYDLEHPSGCGKRMAQLNLISFEKMMVPTIG